MLIIDCCFDKETNVTRKKQKKKKQKELNEIVTWKIYWTLSYFLQQLQHVFSVKKDKITAIFWSFNKTLI